MSTEETLPVDMQETEDAPELEAVLEPEETGSSQAVLPGVTRHDGPPATPSAGQHVIRNFCLVLFGLLRDRLDPSQSDIIDAVEAAFVKRSVGRLSKAYRLDESIPDFFRQLSIIDPLQLRLSKLYDIEPHAEMVWTQLQRTMADRTGYLRELAHLRQIYTSHMYLFEAYEGFPGTLEQLVRVVEAQPASAPGRSEGAESLYLECCPITVVTLKQSELVETAAIEAMQEDLRALVESGRSHIILRFSRVEQVSTELVASIIDLHNLLLDQGQTLWLTELGEAVEAAFRTSDPDGAMNIEPAVAAAAARAAEYI